MLAFDREGNAPRIVRRRKSGDQLEEEIEERQATELELVENAIQRILTSLNDKTMKPTVADLTRLMELRREMMVSQPKSITVRWID